MKCPNCGSELTKGVIFCGECGTKIEIAPSQKRFCRECGARIPAGAKFCTECGATLSFDDPVILEAEDCNESSSLSVHNLVRPVKTVSKEKNIYVPSSLNNHQEENAYANGSVTKTKASKLWDRLDIFFRIAIIAIAAILLILLVAILVKKPFAIVFTIVQLCGLVVAIFMHKAVIKVHQNWFKWVILGLSIGLVILTSMSFNWGRHSKTEKTGVASATPEVEATPVPVTNYTNEITSLPVSLRESDFYGTWRSCGLTNSAGDYYSVDELEKLGNYNITDMYTVFKKGGAYVYLQGTVYDNVTWKVTENGVILGANVLVFENGRLSYSSAGNGIVYFEKISDNQNEKEIIAHPHFAGESSTIKDGFDDKTNSVYSLAHYTFSIPNYYYEREKDDTTLKFGTAMEDADAIIIIVYTPMAVTEEEYTLLADTVSRKMLDSFEDPQVIADNSITIATLPGRRILGKGEIDGIPVSFTLVHLFDPKDQNLIGFLFAQKEASATDYSVDADKIVESLHLSSESTITASSAPSSEITPVPTPKATPTPTPKPTSTPTPKATPTPTPKSTPTPKATKRHSSASYHSSNDSDVAKKGNTGVYAYKLRGRNYDQYCIIDFDGRYVYFFNYGNGDGSCARVKITSGDLNSYVLITWHDYGTTWQYALRFNYKNMPDTMIVEDNDHYEYKYSETNLNDAVKLRNKYKIVDY